MRKLLSLIAMLVMSVTMLMAQDKTITGTVIGAEDGEPVIGASVLVTGTQIGTVTDIDGKFSLNVPTSAKTFTVSYVGMTTKTVTIKNNLTIELNSDTELIEEVVVTGYGTMRKASFTGAAQVLSADAANKKADANFVKSLEGTVSGFTMSNSTGMPGTWASVNIRGMGSLSSSSQPLYVVDGMPVFSDSNSAYSLGSNNEVDPMTSINPADIESITVLKDAAATAIYGSRAANGVIVITTKKGGQSKLNINFDVKQGVSAMANNRYELADANTLIDLFAKGWAARYDTSYQEALENRTNYYKGKGWDGKSSTDWWDLVTRSTHYQDYNLSINGTSGDTHYYMSGEYMKTGGLIIGSDMDRYSGRLNLDTKYKHLSAGMNMSLSYVTKGAFAQSTGGTMSSPAVGAMTSWLPFYPAYNEDGTYNTTSTTYNPLAVRDENLGDLYETNQMTINVNPYIKVDFTKGVWFKTNFGANIADTREYMYSSALYNNQYIASNGKGYQNNTRMTTITWNNTIGWDHTFNKVHNVNVLLGQEMQKQMFLNEEYEMTDFPFASSGMRDMSTAGSPVSSQFYKRELTLASYFADLHYDYDHKYIASASYRVDGSSVFGANNRWGNFWSYGLTWRVKEEAFLKDNEVLSNLTARFSQGVVGNQSLSSWYAARGFYKTGYNYDNTSGMVPLQIANPDLTWEQSDKINLGFDFGFFNRVNASIDFYNEMTSDALYEVPLSFTTGMASAYQNLGKIRNRGIELSLSANLYKTKNVNVNFTGTLAWNQNRVIKLNTSEPIESTYTILEEGRPYRQFYMVEYAGLDRETGKAMFYKNEEGDETTYTWTEAKKRYVGSAEPKVSGGFGFNATFYGFDASLQFNYKIGNKVYDSGKNFTGYGMSGYNVLKDVAENSWTPENKDAKYPQWIWGDTSSLQHSTRFLYDGSYLRLSNISLGYTVPSKLLNKLMIQKCRIYTTFDNVYTWMNKDFMYFTTDTYASGQIAWQYPAVFTFTGGIQLTF